MRIVFISRSTLFSVPGGDTIQIESTAKYLRKLNVSVDIKLTNEKINYAKYDLMHFFNIIRPSDILTHVENSNKPYVISTIFVDYSEFDKKHPLWLIRIIRYFFSPDMVEYIKTIIRAFKNGESVKSGRYLWKGHRKSIVYLLQNAKCLLPNSESEYCRLKKEYDVSQKYKVIPNGIDLSKFKSSSHNQIKEGILCVGRVEGLKNQLNLIRAFRNTNFKLLIIGKAGPNHAKYYKQCVEEATSNISFLNHLSQDELIEYYKNAKVHVLPSYFETTGLSSLEAAFMGCNIVITNKGDTYEYFKDFAFYCDPNDPSTIYDKVIEAYRTPYNNEFRDYLEKNFSWEIAANKTLEAYQEAFK